jgi:hypothetical protein
MATEGPQVSLLAKDLPSYAFVRDTYLEHGGLPDVPWLAERQRPFPPDTTQRRLAGERRP